MSELLEIQKQLSVANQRVAELERAMADHPTLKSIAANLDSAVRIRGHLELQFAEAAEKVGYEICKYRAFDENNKEKVAASFGAIALFQKLVSVVFGAQKYGEKSRATISEKVERETAFGFGYAFTGSLGVVLTARNPRPILELTELDTAIETAFDMARSMSPKDIQAYAEKLGPGPVHALYNWANANAESGLGADVEWLSGNSVKSKLFIQRQQLAKLRSAIEKTSSESERIQEIEALLTMADVTNKKFKFRQDVRMRVKGGTVEPGVIDEKHRVGLPQKYLFTLRITTTTKFSTGEEKTRYHLLKLKELPPRKEKDGSKKTT